MTDVVRGGNVLGEETFFQKHFYKEDAWVESSEACVLQVSAECMNQMRYDRFMDKATNQRYGLVNDFRQLFQFLQ